MSDREETYLVLLAQSGDRDALGELLQRVQPALRGYLRLLKRDASAADDVLQDTFVIAVRKLRFLRDAGLFRPWIYRIATREAHRRGRQSDDALQAHHEPASDVDTERTLLDREAREQLRDEVSKLPERSRDVIALHYFAEMTLEEVAAVLESPLGTIKSRLAYGLAALREREAPR